MQKIIKLHKDEDPRLNALKESIYECIDTRVQGTDITIAAVIGVLETVKFEILEDS